VILATATEVPEDVQTAIRALEGVVSVAAL
jgi:hypothetical protein